MKKIEFWGGLVTTLYLTLMGWWVAAHWGDFLQLDLNELGDFLAGAFGPIAFLWLVLGFLQQGRELKLSTDALRLQAEELKNSVAQQSIMAQAAVEQIDAARKAVILQMEEAERAVSADFEVGPVVKSGTDGQVKNRFRITNNRNVAYKVICEFTGDLPFLSKFELGTLKAGSHSEEEYIFPHDHPGAGMLTIFYEDVNGREKVDIFDIWISNGWIKHNKHRNKSSNVVRA